VRIHLVVGLGNPGAEYAASRHNVGFRVVDELARRHRGGGWRTRCLSMVTRATLDVPVLLAKPLTYMNRSGQAVARLLDHLEIEPPQMLVVVDDVDLALGALRLRRSGGPGTHNGLRDICSTVGEEFPRLRVGVRGGAPWEDLADYVTSPFSAVEEELLGEIVGRAADAVETAVAHDLNRAMSEFNRRDGGAAGG
jgi:peptidyl-tRNA hydrolase, PTH1 family